MNELWATVLAGIILAGCALVCEVLAAAFAAFYGGRREDWKD